MEDHYWQASSTAEASLTTTAKKPCGRVVKLLSVSLQTDSQGLPVPSKCPLRSAFLRESENTISMLKQTLLVVVRILAIPNLSVHRLIYLLI